MTEPTAELLIRRDLFAVRVGGGYTVVSLAGGGEPIRLRDPVAAALMSCRGFDSLSGHVARAMRQLKLPEPLRGPLTEELDRLRQTGLVTTWRDLASQAAREAAAPLQAVGILTRNRPEALARALRSHISHGLQHGRHLPFTVIDSSTDPDGARRTQDTVGAIAAETGASIAYAGAAERADFIRRLADRAGIESDLVRFALCDVYGCGHDVGSNRNALLLGHPGRVFLSSDDDVICEPHRPEPAGDLLRVTAENDPTEVRLFPDLPVGRRQVPVSAAGVFQAHEGLLGRSLLSLLAERTPANMAVEPLPAPVLSGLLDGQARVVVTSSGLLGDCGARFPAFYLSRDDVGEQLGAAADDLYRRLLESRQIVRLPAGPTVTCGRFLMSTHLAFDQRVVLPPFFPVYRGEDLTFGHLLRLASDAHLIGHAPIAILHQPIEQRFASLESLWPADLTPTFATILDSCLTFVGQGCSVASGGGARLRLLGRHLRELGELPPPEIDHLLRVALAESLGPRLSALTVQIERLGERSAFARDLQRLLRHNLDSTSTSLKTTASEPIESHGAEQAPRLTRTLIARFGQLLECWPDIVAAAGELDRAGEGLFRLKSTAAV